MPAPPMSHHKAPLKEERLSSRMAVDAANPFLLDASDDQPEDRSDDSTVPRIPPRKSPQLSSTDDDEASASTNGTDRRKQLLNKRGNNPDTIHTRSQKLDGLDGLPPSKKNILLNARRLHRGILKSQKHSKGGSNRRIRSVSFSNIYIREYARTVGDNPSVSSGPPLSISWEHTSAKTMPLEKYESARRPRRNQERLIVPRKVRERWLIEVWGVKQSQIAQAVRANLKIQNSRRTTFHNSGKATEKVEEAMEKTKRGWFGNRTDKKANRLEEQQKLASAHAARNAVAPQAAADSVKSSFLKPGKQRQQSRRLTGSHKVEEEFVEGAGDEEFAVPSQAIAFIDLIKIQKEQAKYKGRGILRNGPGSSTNADSAMDSSKYVSFASNASSKDNKVWCLVKEVDFVDEALHQVVWWPEDDMEERYEQDMEIAALVQDQYGDLLRGAFKSTKVKTNREAELDFEQMSMCNIARGLEKEVMPEIGDISSMHSEAVLQKQELLRSGGSNRSLDEDDMESIRQSSLKYSRPSRMIAWKLAEFDHHDRHFE